jgi:hypothetical protein
VRAMAERAQAQQECQECRSPSQHCH